MVDLIYVAATCAFFALMLGYVAACDHLGRATTEGSGAPETKP
jgi:hypothetical protein